MIQKDYQKYMIKKDIIQKVMIKKDIQKYMI